MAIDWDYGLHAFIVFSFWFSLLSFGVFNGSVCVSKGQIRALMVWVELYRVWMKGCCLGGLLRCVMWFMQQFGGKWVQGCWGRFT